MLKARVLTAAVLLAGFGAALFLLPQLGWIAFCAALLAGAAWEWGGLAALSAPGRWAYTVFQVLLFLLLVLGGPRADGLYGPNWLYYVSAIFWLTLVPLWLWRRRHQDQTMLLGAGYLMLLPAGAALVDLRAGHPGLLLAVLGTVWISDSAAYFVGRRLGKRKLAPSISPGKTWEGVAGALIAVALYALVWASLGAPGNRLLEGPLGGLALAAVLVGLAIVGIIGDLLESLIKRQAGVKDSGNLLPGHGGILDRIDAPVAMLPLAVLAFMR